MQSINPIEDQQLHQFHNFLTLLKHTDPAIVRQVPATVQESMGLNPKQLNYVTRLEQQFRDLKIILDTTVEHSTQLENELEEKSEVASSLWRRYEFIFNSSKDWMCVIDKDYNYESVNQAFLKAINVDQDYLLGKPFATLWGEERFNTRIKPALKKVFQGEEYRDESWVNLPRVGQKCLEMTIYPFRTESGAVVNAIFFAKDITQRINNEELIKEQSALLENAQDAIYVQDANHKITFWNKGAETLYGWRAEDVLDKKLSQLIFPRRGRNKYNEVLNHILKTGEWSGEMTHRTKDNREVIVNSRWTALAEPENENLSIMIINTDITEKKSLESQFLRAQRLESIGMLSGGIAHDLNNILSPFFMAVQTLGPRIKDPQGKEVLRLLEASALRGAQLVKQLLAFARGMEGEKLEVQLKHVIAELGQIVKETFPKAIRFVSDVPSDLSTVYGDATQLYQVFLNLCLNARDAMPQGGSLQIKAQEKVIKEPSNPSESPAGPGTYVQVTVEDTGVGIEKEIIEKIFEPFFTTKTEGKGTGLGLSTTKALVQAHDGFITVDSTLNKGTVFKLFFPVRSKTNIEPTATLFAQSPKGKGEHILLVDDDEAIREIAKAMLESYGYKVQVAVDGAAGLKALKSGRGKFDAVIIDLEMPNMDGLTAMQKCRKLYPKLNIIGTSGFNQDDQSDIDPKPWDQFVPKPIVTEQLLRVLDQLLHP